MFNEVDSKQQLVQKFRERLESIMKERGESPKEFANEVGIKTLVDWMTPSYASLPHPTELVKLAHQLNKSIDWLLGIVDNPVTSSLDKRTVTIIADEKYDEARRQVIADAKEELWIQLRAGGTLHGYDSVIPPLREAIRERKLKLRLLIGDEKDNNTVAMIALRRGDNDIESVKADISKSLRQIERLAKEGGVKEQLKIVQLPFVVPSLVWIADPHENGSFVALISNFNVQDLREAPMISSSKASDEKMFKFFVEDFIRLWEFGSNKALEDKL